MELSEVIKARHPDLPVVPMTVNSADSLVREGLREGDVAAATKPWMLACCLCLLSSLSCVSARLSSWTTTMGSAKRWGYPEGAGLCGDEARRVKLHMLPLTITRFPQPFCALVRFELSCLLRVGR